jgi:uncharacterized protein (TIGR02679 family)
MSNVDIDRLHRLLGRDETRWLVERVRARMERGQPLTGQVSLDGPTAAQRRAIETLLGRPPGLGRSLTVSLESLDDVIRRNGIHADGLGGAAITLGGPVTVRPEAQAAEDAAWLRALAPLANVVAVRPVLRPWYDRICAQGLVKRLCRSPDAATPVVEAAARLLGLLPVSGIPLGQMATTVAGDAHGLDPGRPLATIALSAIRHTWWVGSALDTTPAPRRRAVWDCVGIVTDELSSTVLALNLRPIGSADDAGLGRLLVAARECGEPVVLTLRQLTRYRVPFDPGSVFVCENPSVVLAAANTLGPQCPPLVCVGGQPTAAVLRLLEQLETAGCSLMYHGDFDWGGVRIANLLWSRFAMRPWRYDTGSYSSRADAGRRALTGQPVAATWDADLGPAITRHGIRVEEEAVMIDLLADLADPDRSVHGI